MQFSNLWIKLKNKDTIYMIKRSEFQKAQKEAFAMIKQSGFIIQESEFEKIDIVDFGLGNLRAEGIEVFTMYATERTSAKILVLFPNQTEPEHWHPPFNDNPGKEEIIRAIQGELRFYIPGDGEINQGFIPKGKDGVYTVRNEIILKPGDQLILPPGTKHWFQAGETGAVMYSFSTCVKDGLDRFTDPDIVRETKIIEDL